MHEYGILWYFYWMVLEKQGVRETIVGYAYHTTQGTRTIPHGVRIPRVRVPHTGAHHNRFLLAPLGCTYA